MTSKTKTPETLTESKKDGALRDEQLDQVTGGSQSTGSGAGKITFNPFSITRKTDVASP